MSCFADYGDSGPNANTSAPMQHHLRANRAEHEGQHQQPQLHRAVMRHQPYKIGAQRTGQLL